MSRCEPAACLMFNMCIYFFPEALCCLDTCHAKNIVSETTVRLVVIVGHDESSKGMHSACATQCMHTAGAQGITMH